MSSSQCEMEGQVEGYVEGYVEGESASWVTKL